MHQIARRLASPWLAAITNWIISGIAKTRSYMYPIGDKKVAVISHRQSARQSRSARDAFFTVAITLAHSTALCEMSTKKMRNPLKTKTGWSPIIQNCLEMKAPRVKFDGNG